MPQFQASSAPLTDESQVTPQVVPQPAAGERDDALPSILTRHHYAVASVEPADMGDGGNGPDWYRYVLASGPSRITGFHRGNLEEVTEYANGCADAFNQRNQTGKSSRVTTSNLKKS